ncbi:ATP-binding protein [Nocardiopsis composta]|uniref:Tetratricopeptide (TPR) repeat protein n=1 Tax=Nocardiopsis composta TaxID=157465 RepID=A0A7W8QHU2_9ACTN|nr:tetratricopeptide repeat protein [Nocardiopsis composta]MBB5430742.1 tetratricopeptide (TPR) repeat protein [Nocardiopsis composta]
MAPGSDPAVPDHPRPTGSSAPLHLNAATAVGGGRVLQAGTVHGGVHLYAAQTRDLPRHRPSAPGVLVDRAEETALLRADAEAARSLRTPRLRVLTGTGGVGKTAVAAAFLSAAAEDFPDGCLVADLAGFAPSGPADPAGVLDSFLRALGLRPAEIPADLAGRARLFQACTHGRSMALLLDNAAGAAQVVPLLPGEGGHLVVVTTRLHLPALLARGARFTPLGPLEPDDAAGLLESLVGGHRGDLAGSARGIAELCGNLPLALCAAAGRLVLRPERPAELMLEELGSERRRLSALSRDAEVSVRIALDASYLGLPPSAARLYRLLGLHPGPDFTAEDAALLAGADRYGAEEDVERLVAASLLEERGGRLAFHDLVRLHARQRCAEESPQERRAALDRLVGGVLRTAVEADFAVNPHRWHLGPGYAEAARRRPGRFAGRDAALEWLEAELATLESLVGLCAQSGRNEQAWQLCEALWGVFTLHKHYDAWFRTHRAGLAAAEALGEPAAQGRMRNALAAAHLNRRDAEAAIGHYRAALELWRGAGHGPGEAAALEGLGVAELVRGDPEAAAARFGQALELAEGAGEERAVALLHRHLGEALSDAGRPAEAAPHFRRALVFFDRIGDRYMVARTLVRAAAAHLEEGEADAAAADLEEALRAARQAGADLEEARVLDLTARLERVLGRRREAREVLLDALAIYRRIGAVEAEALERCLAEWDREDAAGGGGAGRPAR